LVDDEVVDSVARLGSSFLADGVNLVEDDTVQLTFRAFLLLLLSGVLEKLSYLFFAFAYKFIENFRPVDYLRQNFQNCADLPCDEGLSGARGSV